MIYIIRVANKIHMLLPPHGVLTQEQQNRNNKTVCRGSEKELVGQNITGKTQNKFNLKLNEFIGKPL